jgi:hypothetical protein
LAPAALTFPVIFAGDDRVPLAVMGLNQQENLFIGADGSIEPNVYIPAYIRRYPFVLANDDTQDRLIVCIDRGSDLLSEKGDTPLFDAKGEPTEYTQNCIKFCDDFEVERRRTDSFVQILKDNDLFELKQATFQPQDETGAPVGEPVTVAEYYGVSEEKLNALPAEKLKELQQNGALAQIYAHIVSLLGWDRLINKTMFKQQEAANPELRVRRQLKDRGGGALAPPPFSLGSASSGYRAKMLRVRQEKTRRPASSSRSCWAMTMPLPSPTGILAHHGHAAAQQLADGRVAHPAQGVDAHALGLRPGGAGLGRPGGSRWRRSCRPARRSRPASQGRRRR